MSGGRFEYQDMALKDTIFGYGCEHGRCGNVFEDLEISELVFDVLDLIHEYDWYASGDTDEDDYIRKKNEFKRKWLSNPDERVKRIIDQKLNETKDELYKTYWVKE